MVAALDSFSGFNCCFHKNILAICHNCKCSLPISVYGIICVCSDFLSICTKKCQHFHSHAAEHSQNMVCFLRSITFFVKICLFCIPFCSNTPLSPDFNSEMCVCNKGIFRKFFKV